MGSPERGSNYRPSGRAPVQVGKEYEVEVTAISEKGDGIARIQGYVIFVRSGKIGQNAKVRIISVGERFAISEIV